jgi:hypothetical protein
VHGSNPICVSAIVNRFHLFRIIRTNRSVNTNCPPLRIFLGRCRRSFPNPCTWSVDVSERAGGRSVSEKGRPVAAPRRAAGIKERRHRCRPSVRLFGGKTDLKSTLFRAACAAAPSVTRGIVGPAIWEVGRGTTASATLIASTLEDCPNWSLRQHRSSLRCVIFWSLVVSLRPDPKRVGGRHDQSRRRGSCLSGKGRPVAAPRLPAGKRKAASLPPFQPPVRRHLSHLRKTRPCDFGKSAGEPRHQRRNRFYPLTMVRTGRSVNTLSESNTSEPRTAHSISTRDTLRRWRQASCQDFSAAALARAPCIPRHRSGFR